MKIKLTSRVGVFTLLLFLNSTLTFAQQPATAKKTCLSGNCINGKGKVIYPNGDTYEGDFVNNIPDGFGTFTEINGNVYVGQMSKSEFQGKGKFFWKSGSVYEGDFVKNKREGKGKTSHADGNYFVGEYKGDWQEGFGKRYDKTTNTLTEGIWKGSTLVKSSSVSTLTETQKEGRNILSDSKEAAVDANIAARKAQISGKMQDAEEKKTNKERLQPAKEMFQMQKDLVQYISEAVNGNELSEKAKSKFRAKLDLERTFLLQLEKLVKITEEASNSGL